MESLECRIFDISTPQEFELVAIEIYHFQYERNRIYREFVNQLNLPTPKNIFEIPFLPISFFKSHEIISTNLPITHTFLSSGTTSENRSKHLVQKIEMYEKSFLKSYNSFIGNPKDQVILGLLPNYIEQGNSSLVYMVERLIKETKNELSGFYLKNSKELVKQYHKAVKQNKKVVIFGVSYALLDLAEKNIDLSKAIIIETGGMKGRRKELSKEQLHDQLKKGLNCESIASEYGMTELFSQSYSNRDGLFELPNWMQIILRDTNDPFSYVKNGKTGGINVVDLANLYSCSFIATQDLGKINNGMIQLMGRFDNSDIRGCNLMVE